MVSETDPSIRLCADSVEPAWDSVSFPLSALPLLSLSLSPHLSYMCVLSLSLKN